MEEENPVPKTLNRSAQLGALLRERWPEYLIEIFVIIFSISISFALDEWKDNRHQKELEQLYLKELAEDITADINKLEEVIAETRLVIQKSESLLKVDQKGTSPNYEQFVKDVGFIFKRPRFVARDATFSDLKSTGNMQVISSFPLKNALFDYYSHYASVVQVETTESEASNALLGPYILKRMPLGNGRKNAQEATLRTISSEIEFQNVVLIRQSTRQELLGDYEDLLAETKQILVLTKAQSK